MKKGILLTVTAILLGGCATTTHEPDTLGWRQSQKKEFLNILSEDKYASLCEQEPLYAKVKQTQDSALMGKLLVEYADNLANGCIDLKSFNAAQAKRNIETHYDVYLQKVDAKQVYAQVKAGQSIEEILAPYMPQSEQFGLLLAKYNQLKKDSKATQVQIDKLRLNIERTKLMRFDLGTEYALINIPEFKVRLKKDGETKLQFGVIVGKRHLQTPIFGEPMLYITLNPQWSVPDSIARNEVIPALIKDPHYLARNNLVIRGDYNLDSSPVSLESIDLQRYKGGKGHVPFKFIERPSRGNVLGRVKFLFPNRHSVYMHDTQTKNLFKRKVRMFSHGCMRLEKPNDMLKYIAVNYTNETEASIMQKYNSMKTHHISLKKRLMVQTAYLTDYVDEKGNLLTFDDVYGFDKIQKLTY